MSATDSNLPNVGYDLVLGVTQDAVNANLKRYLDSYPEDFAPAYYFYSGGGYTLYSEENALNRMNNINPFTLPSIEFGYNDQGQMVVYDGPDDGDGERPSHLPSEAEEATIQSVQQIYLNGFSFAFSASVGFDRNSPDVVVFDTGDKGNDQQVLYQLYFETFQVVGLQEVHGDYTFTNVAQPEDNPWMYSWTVDLNISTSNTALEDLPPDTQDALQNLNNGSMFSIQQLALDLNNAPQYNGLISDSGAPIEGYPDFNTYLNSFWDYLKNTEATILLNAALPTAPSNSPAPTLQPTALNFLIKYYDGSVENGGLDTLNYVLMSNDHPLPNPLNPLTWNWLEPSSSSSQPSGIMAVKRDDFVKYIQYIFDQNLSSICLIPTIDVQSFNNPPFVYSQSFDTNQSYSVVNNGGSHVLTTSFRSPTSKDSSAAYKSEIWASIQSDIYFEGNTIRCVTLGEVYMDLELLALYVPVSKTRGYAVAQQNTATFTMKANPDGSLSIEMEEEIVDLTQDTDKDGAYYDGDLDPSWFADTFGDMGDIESHIEHQVDNLKTWMNNYDNSIEDLLNNTTAWVFPGAATFSMLNPYFSDNQDLTVEVSYTTTN